MGQPEERSRHKTSIAPCLGEGDAPHTNSVAQPALAPRDAAVVRRIFDDYVRQDISMRQIAIGLTRDGVRSPTGRAVWCLSTIGRILRNEAYIGRVYYNQTETVAPRRPTGRSRQVPRPRDQWIAIAVPAILDETLFKAAQRVSRDHSQWNPRRAEPGHWLLRGLVKCGHCGVGVACHKARARNGPFNRYYYCSHHDPFRADALDAFVFEQVREALLRPEVLLAGEHAVSARREPVADELLQAQLARLQRKSDAAHAEQRRLVDLYQAGLIDRDEVLRRSREVRDRQQNLEQQCDALIVQRKELAQQNALRDRIIGFSATVGDGIDQLDFDQRQKLLRLIVEQVRVRGWRVDIKLRIPLEEAPDPPDRHCPAKTVSVPLMQMAWRWVRFQPDSALSQWFQARTAGARGRIRRVMIVAVARKLLIALWRYADTGLVPTGARVA